MPAFEKLSKRLDYLAQVALQQHVLRSYTRIYDTCCDHGYLGMYLLQHMLMQEKDTSIAPAQLLFVDQLEPIVEQLKQPLRHFPSSSYQCFATGFESLKLEPNQRSLLIVAGIGGTLMSELLALLLEHNTRADFDLLLCPSNEANTLRCYLQSTPLSLHKEAIISDKQRHYEVLLLRYACDEAAIELSDVGRMWQAANPDHVAYQQRLLAHYRRKAKTALTPKLRRIIKAYENCFV